MQYNALSVGKKTPKTAPSPLDFVTLPEEDRATAIGNAHRKIGKDRTCVSGDIRRTDALSSSQYFATVPRSRGRRNKKFFILFAK